MKKIAAIILSLVFILSLPACASKPSGTEGGSASSSSQGGKGSPAQPGSSAAPSPSGGNAGSGFLWKDHNINESFYDTNTSDSALVTLAASLPSLQDCAEINAYYDKKGEEIRREASGLLDLAKDSYLWAKKNGGFFYPYTVEASYQVLRNDGRVFSVTRSVYTNTGGAHPGNALYGDSFDAKTGALITADELFSVPLADALDKLKPALIAEMDKRSEKEGFDLYYPNARADLISLWDGKDFYFADGSLVLVWQEYQLAPHAGGVQQFSFPLSEITDLINAKWKLS